jgi:hypothetical protein
MILKGNKMDTRFCHNSLKLGGSACPFFQRVSGSCQIIVESENFAQALPLPNIQNLPDELSEDGSLRLELHEGVPVAKASSRVQK